MDLNKVRRAVRDTQLTTGLLKRRDEISCSEPSNVFPVKVQSIGNPILCQDTFTDIVVHFDIDYCIHIGNIPVFHELLDAFGKPFHEHLFGKT